MSAEVELTALCLNCKATLYTHIDTPPTVEAQAADLAETVELHECPPAPDPFRAIVLHRGVA